MSPPDDPRPASLGRYRLFDELGRDALGVSYLACPAGSRTFPAWAVVRRMHPGVARDPAMIHAFVAATQAAVRMVHRNIVNTFDFGGTMGVPWSAREHIVGVSVVSLVASLAAQRKKVPWTVATHLVAEAAEGVAALRASLPTYGPPIGPLTGSVAPSLFVSRAGDVKIVDGCLPLLDGAPLIDSQALPYRPREPTSDGQNAGRADAFGLAVVLWELVAGRRLFAGQTDEETARLLDARLVPSLRALAKAPPAFDEIVARSVARAPLGGTTIASAADLAAELRASLVAGGERTSREDVARVLRDVLGASLDADDARIAGAWEREQSLTAAGDGVDDASGEGELTVRTLEPPEHAADETEISSRRSERRAVGFDDVPTVPKSPLESVALSWRTLPPASTPPSSASLASIATRIPAPAIHFVPEDAPEPPVAAGTPGEVRAPPYEPPVIVRPTPAAIVLPPVERSVFPPPPPLPPRVPESALAARRAAPPGWRSPVFLSGAAGFLVALLGIVVYALLQPRSEEAQATLVTTGEGRPPAASARPPTPNAPPPSTGAWNVLPTATIPTASPDELPRASTPPRAAPPAAAPGPTGLLTVFCTPACDQVYDGARPLGPSPVFKMRARAGLHTLRLRVEALSLDKTVTVRVAENETTVVRESLGE